MHGTRTLMRTVSTTSDLTSIWADTETRLPAGWQLDGLRCASTGLTPDQRSREWVAVAVGPGGEQRSLRSLELEDALRGLATEFETAPEH